jgi:release factor glutamine methyltransferase
VFGFTLRVEPTVFHPALFRSTRLLARHLLCQDLAGRTVLDMGTGSGIAALCAARQGARATAVDVNPRAVACARANAAANGLADRVEVVESDLFAAIQPGARFDLISWNPPFYPEQPSGAAELAWKAGPDYDVIAAFARAVPAFLLPGGLVLLVLSSDVDVPRLLRLFTDQGFAARTVRRSRGLFETLTLEELAVRAAE